jgi:hypothetical protein
MHWIVKPSISPARLTSRALQAEMAGPARAGAQAEGAADFLSRRDSYTANTGTITTTTAAGGAAGTGTSTKAGQGGPGWSLQLALN